jgi:hypothetical protein
MIAAASIDTDQAGRDARVGGELTIRDVVGRIVQVELEIQVVRRRG